MGRVAASQWTGTVHDAERAAEGGHCQVQRGETACCPSDILSVQEEEGGKLAAQQEAKSLKRRADELEVGRGRWAGWDACCMAACVAATWAYTHVGNPRSSSTLLLAVLSATCHAWLAQPVLALHPFSTDRAGGGGSCQGAGGRSVCRLTGEHSSFETASLGCIGVHYCCESKQAQRGACIQDGSVHEHSST